MTDGASKTRNSSSADADFESIGFEVDAHFGQFESFQDTIQAWNLDFYQLDRGAFQARLRQLGFAGVQVGEVEIPSLDRILK